MAMDLSSVTNFLGGVPADWILVGTVALFLTIDAIRVGVGRISALGFSFLISLIVGKALEKAAYLGAVSGFFSTPVLQAALFCGIFLCVFLLTRRITIDYAEMGGQPIQALFGGVAVTLIMIVAWLQIPPLTAIWNFDTQVQVVFGEAYRFWWLIGSFAALAFARN